MNEEKRLIIKKRNKSSPNKLAIWYVRGRIKRKNYILLSNEYINNATKIKIKCPNNHIFEMTYNNFKSGHRCPICSRKKAADSVRLTYTQVKNQIESIPGYDLLSKYYINNRTKLHIKCHVGHDFLMSYNGIQSGHRCPLCKNEKTKEMNKNKKYTYDFKKNYIESFEGHKLIEGGCGNNSERMKIECPDGHIFEITFANFKQGSRCPIVRRSKAEKEITNYIRSIYFGDVRENDRTQITNPLTKRKLELDIWLPELNKAIEYNGTFYHKNRDHIDAIKRNKCEEKGIDLLVIGENKWNGDFDIINNFIHRRNM